MDWNTILEFFGTGLIYSLIVVVVLVVLFFLYYGFHASRGAGRVERAKIRARQIVESGQMPDQRTFDYIYYMLSRVPRDPEAVKLRGELNLIKKNATASGDHNPGSE